MTLPEWDAECIAAGCTCDCHAGRTFCTCVCRGDAILTMPAVADRIEMNINIVDKVSAPLQQIGLGFERLERSISFKELEPNLVKRLTFGTTEARLYRGDSIELMRHLAPGSIDLVFADPPYQLSNGGTTCSGGERVSVDKGEWDASRGQDDDYAFHLDWLTAVQRVLKRTGTLWVTGTHHCIFNIGFAMQRLGFHVLNTVPWCKPNASPNLGCRQFTHSVEWAIWAAPHHFDPLEHVFHYADVKAFNDGKQMRDYWEIPVTPPSEKVHGVHPTQKPLALLDRIMRACHVKDGWVLDPFCGSGTTAVAGVNWGMNVIGMDLDADHLATTERRLVAGQVLA